MKTSETNSTKTPPSKCEICGTFTKKPDGCTNINHFINDTLKGKKG